MKPRVPFSPEVAERIWTGLDAGRGLRRICREPGMPTRATVMRWLRERPDFADTTAFARWMGGLDGVGLPCGLRNGVGSDIFDRLAAGEPLRTICRDPAMPSRSTVHTWMRRDPEFAQAVTLARDLAAWAAAELKWEAINRAYPFPIASGPPEPPPFTGEGDRPLAPDLIRGVEGAVEPRTAAPPPARP